MVLIAMDRMRLALLMIAVLAVEIHGKTSSKKSQKELEHPIKKETSAKKPAQKAIIAIEIVDPNDNSTKSGKGRKRTIESSLGYGYQSFFNVQQRPPKYEVYRYSQQDIPASSGGNYKGHQQNQIGLTPPAGASHSHGGQGINVQKAIRYDLGSTKPEYIPNPKLNLNQYYQPGTTLFSTLDQQGHIGGLSAQAPQHHPGDAMVPVIILRVFTNQLTQPGALHANIPQNHPYANINNIDLQNLLAGYVQNHYQNYQDQGYYYPEQQYHDGLQTHENYPDDSHTKVIFHKDSVKPQTKLKSTTVKTPVVSAPQKFKITIPENTFSKVEIQDHSYQPQDNQGGYYYDAPEQYYQPQAQEYQAPVQYQDAKQYVQIQTYPQQPQYQAPTQAYSHPQQGYVAQPTQVYLPQQAYVQQSHQAQQVYYEQPQGYQESAYSGYEQVYQAPQSTNHHGTISQKVQTSYQTQKDDVSYQPQKDLQAYHSALSEKDLHDYQAALSQKDIQSYQASIPQKDLQYQSSLSQSYSQNDQSVSPQKETYQTNNDQLYQKDNQDYSSQIQQDNKQYQSQQSYPQGFTAHAGASEQYLREVQTYQNPQDEQKLSLQDASAAAGRDLHAKLYNYHAHGSVQQPKTRSTHKKRRAKFNSAKNNTTKTE